MTSDLPAEGSSEGNDPASEGGIRLWSGDFVNLAGASYYKRRGNERLILLAGLPDSGKTSLLIAPYVRLLGGPIGEVNFSETRTLIGFEKRCHLSRIKSAGSEPDIDRTKLTDVLQILHLDLKIANQPEIRTLLLPDISGEAFELAADSDHETEKLAIMREADYLAFLIDAGKLLDVRQRHAAVERLRLMVQSLKRANLIELPEVTLLATKIDLVPLDQRNTVIAMCQELAEEFQSDELKVTVQMVSTRKRAETPYEGLQEEMLRWVG